MAHLHEALANDLLDAANDRGWVHLQAAVTAWVKAGDAESYQRAVAVIANGIERCAEGWHNPTLLGMLWDLFGWVLQHPFPETPSGDSRHPRLSPDEESRVRDVLLMLAGQGVAELAHRCDLSVSTVSGLLSGKRSPGPKVLANVAKALGWTVDQLIGREPLPKAHTKLPAPERTARSSAA